MGRFLKHSKTGRVYPWTIQLDDKSELLPCDEKGNLLIAAHARFDQSDLSLRERILAARTKIELVEIGMAHDIGFAEDDDIELTDAQTQLIDALIKINIISPTEEDIDRMSRHTLPGEGEDGGADTDGGEDGKEPPVDPPKDAETIALEKSDKLRSDINACRAKTDVRTINADYEGTEFPEEMLMKDMKVDLIKFLEGAGVLLTPASTEE